MVIGQGHISRASCCHHVTGTTTSLRPFSASSAPPSLPPATPAPSQELRPVLSPPLHWLCADDFPMDSPARPSLQSSGMASTNSLELLDLQSPQVPRNQHNPNGTHHLSKANLPRSPLAMNRSYSPRDSDSNLHPFL